MYLTHFIVLIVIKDKIVLSHNTKVGECFTLIFKIFELVKKENIGEIELDFHEQNSYKRNDKQVEFSAIKWGA